MGNGCLGGGGRHRNSACHCHESRYGSGSPRDSYPVGRVRGVDWAPHVPGVCPTGRRLNNCPQPDPQPSHRSRQSDRPRDSTPASTVGSWNECCRRVVDARLAGLHRGDNGSPITPRTIVHTVNREVPSTSGRNCSNNRPVFDRSNYKDFIPLAARPPGTDPYGRLTFEAWKLIKCPG